MACDITNTYRALGTTITRADLPDSCGNWCKNVQGTGSILENFGCGVSSLGQAIDLIAQEVSSRLGGVSFSVRCTSSNSFVLNFRLSQGACDLGVVTLVTTGKGSFPITVQWERSKRGTSGISMFQTLDSFIEYIVAQFKR